MTEPMSYVGKCKGCKSIVAATVDIPGQEKRTAQDVAEFIKDGMEIERCTCQHVRDNFDYCKCKKQPEQMSIL